MFELPLKIRRRIRKEANAGARVPVSVLADSAVAPNLVGIQGHWETKAGDWIQHPSGYGKRGWSNMRYVCSTVCVEVGEQWLRQNLTNDERVLLFRQLAFQGS